MTKQFFKLLKTELKTIKIPTVFIFVSLSFIYGAHYMTALHISKSNWVEAMNTNPGFELQSYFLRFNDVLIPWKQHLIIGGIILAIANAFIQFQLPSIQKTWAFTMHRAVKRSTIISAKIVACVISFIIALLIPFSLLFQQFYTNPQFDWHPVIQEFYHGVLAILFGLVFYLATAVSMIDRAKWFGRKFLPPILLGVLLLFMWVPNFKLQRLDVFTGIVLAGIILMAGILFERFARFQA